MSAPPARSGALPDPDALTAIGRHFAALKTAHAELAAADLDEVVRLVPGKRAILRGRLGERRAIFRLYLDRPGQAAREWAELCRIWPHMRSGAYRVCEPLAHLPKAGLIAVADLPGTPLLQALYAEPPETRSRWLDPAAGWLRAYTDVSETEAAAAPEGWITRAGRAAASQPFHRLRRLEQPILAEIRRIGERLAGGTWRVAISHGDYHPNNLLAEGDSLTGIDCGGSARIPVCKDMARFLMHMGRRGMIPSGEAFLGVDAAGIAAFAAHFALSAQDRDVTLPFFIAVEALIRVETRTLPASRIRRARDMSEALLADLRQIGR